MSVLLSQWLAILVATLVVFVVSWIIHAVLPWHKGDLKKMPNQDQVQDALRPFNLAPGDYMLPGCDSMEEMRSKEFMERMKRGPVVIATVKPSGVFNMGKSLLGWFIYCLIVTCLAAYVGAHTLAPAVPGGAHLHSRRIIALVACIGYSAALWQSVIWYSRSVGTTVRSTIDAVVYGVATALVFGWLA